jgi:hypothetical protein
MDGEPPKFTSTWKTILSAHFNSQGIHRKELAPTTTLCDVTLVAMNLLATPELARAVMPEPSRFVCAISFCLRHQGQGCSQSQLDRPGHASGRLSRLLVLAHVLAAALIIAALTGSAQGQTSVTLAWDPSPDSAIAGYRLYDGVTSETYTNVIDVGRATSATVSNLVNGVTYFFSATAYDTKGQESAFSDEISYAVPWLTNSPPRPPSGLTFVADSGTISPPFSVTLAWAPSPNSAIAGYRLYELVASETDTNVIDVTDVGNATSAAVTNLTNGVTYFFVVTALDRNGQESYFSDEIIYKVSSATNSPSRPPSGLTFVADSGTISPPFSVTLAWAPSPDSAIAGYRLYELVASETDTNVIDVTDVGNATSATVTSLTNGVTYFFAVTARDTFGQESAFSDEISYTVPWPTDSPPTMALTLPANGAVYRAPATISFAADVTSNGHTISQVEFYDGVTLLGAVISAPYSFSWHNVRIGTYSLSAQVVYDSGSTVASAAVNVTVAAILPPSGLTFVADSDTISLLFSGTLAWDPSPDSSIAGYRLYEVVARGTCTNVIDVIDVGNATSATVSNLVNGVTFFFAIRAYDAIGQVSDFSNEISYTATNGPPTLALTWPTNCAVYTVPATINFAAGVVPNGHRIRQVQFYEGVTLLGEVTSAPYSFSWNNVRAGIYSLSAQVVYDSGSTVVAAPVNVSVAPRKGGPGNSQPDSFSLPQQQ